MLSILIPSYNYICTQLVSALSRQAEKATFPVEIIVMDDASTEEHTAHINREINQYNHCCFIENDVNIGRSKIRNMLAEKAIYKLLLFIDCDAGVASDDFLEKYVAAYRDNCVVCGGLLYERPLQNSQNSLRYRYGTHVEERSAMKRSLSPYDGFTTFSFLIPRSLFLQIRFDDSFKGYGHEDTVFGFELQKRQVSVIHIDNSLYHLGLESNKVFIDKTESSVTNLFFANEELTKNTHLLKAYNKICKFKLLRLMSLCFMGIRPLIRWNLLSRYPSLTLFSFYKLGYLCSLNKKGKN